RSDKAHGMKGEHYRRYPKSLTMRQVSVDARDKDNRAEQFEVVTTILDTSRGGGQIADLYERRGEGGGRRLDQVGNEDGRAALQDTPDGRERDPGAPAGVQPAPHRHGRGRGPERRRAAGDQLRPEDRGGAAKGSGEVDRRATGPCDAFPGC